MSKIAQKNINRVRYVCGQTKYLRLYGSPLYKPYTNNVHTTEKFWSKETVYSENSKEEMLVTPEQTVVIPDWNRAQRWRRFPASWRH